jgi:cystathionine beta-lyase/cystathionine gamma-synthase
MESSFCLHMSTLRARNSCSALGLKVVQAPTFEAEDIISTAELHNASAVFIDPVANIGRLPVTNIRHFCQIVSQRSGWENRLVLIDGTMISGAMPVFDWIKGPLSPTLRYYESASKYVHFGLDL